MKHLYLIGGTMGVGKTAVSQILKKRLPKAVMLDGDWCWDADPFVVTDETKAMVMENITFLLNQFIHSSEYEHIIFCWVMHQQEIIREILSKLDLADVEIHNFSLTCSQENLAIRLGKDVVAGIREESVIVRSMARLPLYDKLFTMKVNTDGMTAEDAAERVMLMSGTL